MTDSNHAPFSERERVAWIADRALNACYGLSPTQSDSPSRPGLAVADAILADPTYARVAEMREALRECVEWAEAMRPYAEDGTQVVPVFARARALLGEGKP